MNVHWSDQAIASLMEITGYLFLIDPELATITQHRLTERIDWLALHTMAGSPVKGLERSYREIYALNKKYRVYYQILGEESITVLLIWSTKRPKPSITQILGKH